MSQHAAARSRSSRRAALGAGLILATLIPIAAPSALAAGTISLTGLGVAYTQDFDTLANTGTTNTLLPTGWDLIESGGGARDNEQYAEGTGSSNTGDTYSFGAAASTERAFGGLQSGTLIPTIGASFTNNTGATVTSLIVGYTGEQWRLGTAARVDRIDFQLSTSATSLTTGTWVDIDSLDFTAPVTTGALGARDGNAAENRTAIAFAITGLAIANGSTLWIRWSDFNATGADDGLAVDDFSLTPTQSDAPPSITTTSPLAGAANVAKVADVSITFSEAVNVTGAWFSIACSISGAHPASVSGGPTTFTLDPTSDFAGAESCSVTVFASEVTDQDTDDPPDNMAGNASFSFTTVEVCGDTATLIHDAQGSGLATPLSGAISIEGIVVGDFQGAGQFGGYYVQEEDADADANPQTSEGIFVFNTATPVNLGDKVRVRGNVIEFSNLTELTGVSSVQPCSIGNTLPAATDVNFPVAVITDLEVFEGMRISIDQELTVTEVFTLARFGEVALSVSGRLDNPTNVVAPGAPAIALQDLNNRSRILLDDGDNTQNLDPTKYPQGGLSAANTLRPGDTLPSLSGVLDFRFSVYRVQPVFDLGSIEFDHDNPRPLAPDAVGGNLQVAAFNVLNFFNGDGMGGGFPTARGATTQAELVRQTDKIVSAMLALDADIYSMSELENDAAGELSAIDDLVDALNAVAGAGTFDYVDTGVIGTDAIKVGILYLAAVVSPVGPFAILNTAVDSRFIDTLNRPALAQTFELAGGGGRLTIIANHLKSKGSACAFVGDPDTGDGQGNCNLTRKHAAEALVDWAASDPTGSGDRDVLVVGDLNSYAKEDPIEVFTDAGYTNTIAQFLGDEAYSFVFQGQSGYLDHALSSPTLTPQITGVTEWHINSDEPVALDYNVEFKSIGQVASFYDPGPYRSSDHDPVLIGIEVADLDAVGLLAPIGGGTTANAGQTLPIQFSLGGDQGLDILFETPQVFLCAGWPLGSSSNAQAAGSSGLTYDPVLDRYTFPWRTSKSWANSCRTIEVTFTDGSYLFANVTFTK